MCSPKICLLPPLLPQVLPQRLNATALGPSLCVREGCEDAIAAGCNTGCAVALPHNTTYGQLQSALHPTSGPLRLEGQPIFALPSRLDACSLTLRLGHQPGGPPMSR